MYCWGAALEDVHDDGSEGGALAFRSLFSDALARNPKTLGKVESEGLLLLLLLLLLSCAGTTVRASFSGGLTCECDVLIGADGLRSTVRGLRFGDADVSRFRRASREGDRGTNSSLKGF